MYIYMNLKEITHIKVKLHAYLVTIW